MENNRKVYGRKNNDNLDYSLGMKEYKERKWQTAINYLEKAYTKDRYYRTAFTIGKCYSRIRNNRVAEKYYNETIQLDSKNVYARLELGKLYVKRGKEKEAEKLYKECMELDPKNVHARLELGKIYAKQGKEKEAEKLFKEYMELDSKNVHARLELGKLYAKQGKEKEAEKLFKEYMELDSKNVYARLELGKLYAKQGKEKEAEKLYKECMEIDHKDVHARLELGKLYAEQGKDKESAKMYDYIIQNLGYDIQDEQARINHIMKHMKDDKNKKIHGVLNMNAKDVLDKLDFNKVEKQIVYMADIYCFHIENCGYEGGSEGDGHKLNYLTVITLPNDRSKLITMFPSDEVTIKEKDKNKDSFDEEPEL